MEQPNDFIYEELSKISENIFYALNASDNTISSNEIPYIVYQEISKHPIIADNKAQIYKVEYQVTIVTKHGKDPLIQAFESHFNELEIIPVMISSYRNDDYTINRVYKIEIISKGG